MLSQLCRAQLWPKPSNKWSRRFPRAVRRKIQHQMDSPNIVHFNCSTNNLQGITDPGDSSCCSDEENECSEDSCSEYSCSLSLPLKRDCCCCCQAAENPAYGLSTNQPVVLRSEEPENIAMENEDPSHWTTRAFPLQEMNLGSLQGTEGTGAPQELSDPSRTQATICQEVDHVTRLRGMLNGGDDSPSAFRVVVPKKNATLDVRTVPRRATRTQLSAIVPKRVSETKQSSQQDRSVGSFDPLSVRVELDYPPVSQTNVTPCPEERGQLKHERILRAQAQLKRFSVCEADGLLLSASARNPVQVPMVVMQCARLHPSIGSSAPYQQTSLPMGTLVNALYRDQDWICVQTPHGVRGYLYHSSCTPLGILPPTQKHRSTATDPLAVGQMQKETKSGSTNVTAETGPASDARSAKKKSNMSLEGRSAGRCAPRTKVDNRQGRRGNRVVPTWRTNAECARATLQRNMAGQRAAQSGCRSRDTKKVLEKNIDKLILASQEGDDLPGTKLVTALKALRIETENEQVTQI